jgi:hypothetical protein
MKRLPFQDGVTLRCAEQVTTKECSMTMGIL